MNARIVIKLGVKISSNIEIYESNFIDLNFSAPNFHFIVYMQREKKIENNEGRQCTFYFLVYACMCLPYYVR